jgi:hypothetical protein
VPQVVVFGADQKLRTPISLSAGRHIMITAPSGSDVVTISRFEANAADQEVKTTRNIVDIIRAVGKLKAAYPDVAQMLVQADRQSNLPGRLEIDAMPQAGRIYHRVARTGDKENVRVGDPAQVPNMFPAAEPRSPRELADPDTGEAEAARTGESGESGTASLADVREPENSKSSSRSGATQGEFQGSFRRKDDAPREQ